MLSNLDVSVENPKVAVILPVYNVEQYLKECLESIVIRTLSFLLLTMVLLIGLGKFLMNLERKTVGFV